MLVFPTSHSLSLPCAVNPASLQVAAGGEDGSICVWDLGTSKRIAHLAGHSGPVWSLAYSKGDGALLASGE
jgi:transcription initiation factor TFIID subunit 5